MKPLFLLQNTPEDLWAASVKNPAAVNELRQFTANACEQAVPVYRLLIAYIDQLHDFVRQIPPLAWELLEHAQEPLEIVYPERKHVLSPDEGLQEICVHWVKQPKLLKFLQKEGPLWAVRAASFNDRKTPTASVVDCYDKKYPYQRVKTVVVAADSTFSFLR